MAGRYELRQRRTLLPPDRTFMFPYGNATMAVREVNKEKAVFSKKKRCIFSFVYESEDFVFVAAPSGRVFFIRRSVALRFLGSTPLLIRCENLRQKNMEVNVRKYSFQTKKGGTQRLMWDTLPLP